MNVVYFRNPQDEPVIVAVFQLKVDAYDWKEQAKGSFVSELRIREMPIEAWQHYHKLGEYI